MTRPDGAGSHAPLRVCICDDSEPLRRLVALQLEGRGFAVVGECAEPERCAAAIQSSDPDVILVDRGLAPRAAAGPFFEALRQAAPRAALVLHSGLPADMLARQAAELELDGYLQKGRPAADLRDALAKLAPARR